ncbi:MAG: hypothetical protein WC966_03560 [Bradymonadales bacterium]
MKRFFVVVFCFAFIVLACKAKDDSAPSQDVEAHSAASQEARSADEVAADGVIAAQADGTPTPSTDAQTEGTPTPSGSVQEADSAVEADEMYIPRLNYGRLATEWQGFTKPSSEDWDAFFAKIDNNDLGALYALGQLHDLGLLSDAHKKRLKPEHIDAFGALDASSNNYYTEMIAQLRQKAQDGAPLTKDAIALFYKDTKSQAVASAFLKKLTDG